MMHKKTSVHIFNMLATKLEGTHHYMNSFVLCESKKKTEKKLSKNMVLTEMLVITKNYMQQIFPEKS